MRYFGDYPNRLFCEAAQDLKEALKIVQDAVSKEQYEFIASLAHEIHVMGKRMEAKLDAQKSYFDLRDEISKLKEEYRELKKKNKELGGKDDE